MVVSVVIVYYMVEGIELKVFGCVLCLVSQVLLEVKISISIRMKNLVKKVLVFFLNMVSNMFSVGEYFVSLRSCSI